MKLAQIAPRELMSISQSVTRYQFGRRRESHELFLLWEETFYKVDITADPLSCQRGERNTSNQTTEAGMRSLFLLLEDEM